MLPYEHYIDACLADVVGEAGLSPHFHDTLKQRAAPALAAIRRELADGGLAHFALAARRDDLADLQALAGGMKKRFSRIIILGTGGASAGARALVPLAPLAERRRVTFADNLDGRGFAELLAGLDPRETGFVAISRSGDTVSTLAQYLHALAWLEEHLKPGEAGSHLYALTLPQDSPLTRLSEACRGQVIDYAPAVPGRFAILSAVGLLPAALAGIDVRAVRTGASQVFETAIAEPDCPPLDGAAALVGLSLERRRSQHVMIVYGDALKGFSHWHRVLTAEALGRGGQGVTPVPALGPSDQHGQMQLWLDGPADKQFTVLTVPDGRGRALPQPLADDPQLSALAGHTLGNIVQTQARATIETLAAHGQPARLIRLPRLDEKSLGGLIMHVMLETILAAHLFGVDPYGAPVADAGKSLTQTYLNHAKMRR